MAKLSRPIFLILLITLCLNCGCGSGNTGDKFPAVVFSDIHFNPYDDSTIFNALVATDVSGWENIFKGSAKKTPAPWGADSNYPLLTLALSSIKQNSGGSSVFIFTGDILGHYFPQQYFQFCNCQDQVAMQAFADKTVEFVMDQVRASAGDVPVVFALGNGDSYTGYGPDSTFLSATAELYYTRFLNGKTDHQAFLDSFTAGGYYSVEPLGKDLMVIGLNTILFSPMLKTDTTDQVNVELAWFDARLAAAKAENKKVWLLMHVPPGVDLGTTAGTIDSNGQLAAATMMWKPAFQAAFLQILSKYPGVISLTFAGHTHMDEYPILPLDNVVVVSPSISPAFFNNPAYKVFTFTRGDFNATDTRSLNYDLATKPAQFNDYYVFSEAYRLQGSLNSSLAHLLPALLEDPAKQGTYRSHYYSGHNSPPPDSNIITDGNWPVFSCGIGLMEEQTLVDCVHAH